MLQAGRVCFDTKSSNSTKLYCPEPGLFFSITNNVKAMKTLIQQCQNLTQNLWHSQSFPNNAKSWDYLCDRLFWTCLSKTVLKHIFGSKVAHGLGVFSWGKKASYPKVSHRRGKHKPDWLQNFWWYHDFFPALPPPLYSRANNWTQQNQWKSNELSDT